MSQKFITVSLLFVAAVLVVRIAAEWTPFSIHKDRDYANGVQPFNGKGHKYAANLKPSPDGKEIYTGNKGRSKEWQEAFNTVHVRSKDILAMPNLAIDSTIENLLATGTIEKNDHLLKTTSVKFDCKAEHIPCAEDPATCVTLPTAPVRVPHVLDEQKFEPAKVRACDPKRYLGPTFGWDTCVVITSIDGTCNVTANFSSTPDRTTFALLFNDLYDEANQTTAQRMFDCAFRVPIRVPLGLTSTVLKSALRGYAQSAPAGLVSIGWSAGIGMNEMPPDSWATIYNTDSYDARVWENGTNSVDSGDFDPIMVGMQLDSMNPVFSPCGSEPPSQDGFYDVPVDFIFAFNAFQRPDVKHGVDVVYLDSQDTQTSPLTLTMPTAFEMCDR